MTRRQARQVVLRAFKLLYAGEVEVLVYPFRGSALGDIEGNLIRINPLIKPPLDTLPASPAVTLLHELMHELYPDREEGEVIKITCAAWGALEPAGKLALYEYMFESA